MNLSSNFFGGMGDVLKIGAEGAAWVASWGAVDAARARLDRAVEVEERRRRDLAALLNHFDERVGRSFPSNCCARPEDARFSLACRRRHDGSVLYGHAADLHRREQKIIHRGLPPSHLCT